MRPPYLLTIIPSLLLFLHHLDVYLRAIADVEETHVDHTPRRPSVREHINFTKRQILSDLCQDALKFQNRKYNPDFVENSELAQFIEDQLEMVDALDDRWFLDRVKYLQGWEQGLFEVRYVNFFRDRSSHGMS